MKLIEVAAIAFMFIGVQSTAIYAQDAEPAGGKKEKSKKEKKEKAPKEEKVKAFYVSLIIPRLHPHFLHVVPRLSHDAIL